MKKWPSFVAALTLIVMCIGITDLNAQGWTFKKLFPTNTFQTFNGSGLNNALAVDPAGRLWVAAYSTTSKDSLQRVGTTPYIFVGHIWVFNPSGSEAAFSGMKILNGVDQNAVAVHDTLNGNCLAVGTKANGYSSTTGFRRGPDGNMYLTKGSSITWKLNWQTGAVMQRIINPIPVVDTGQSGGNGSAFCAIGDDGEIFFSTVYGGNLAVARSADFKNVDVQVGTIGGFGRSMVVTGDDSDLYFPRYTLYATLHYHGDPLNGYTFKDSVFKGLAGTASSFDPKKHYLWVNAGGTAGNASLPPWNGGRIYGFDMTNRSNPVLKDSVVYDTSVTKFTHAFCDTRDIAFSPTGDTLYLGLWSTDTTGIEMFVRNVSSVERQPDAVVKSYELSQNYPNPFNPTTEIDFSILNSGATSLKVYDLLGREVAELVNSDLTAGSYKVKFDGTRLSSGTYIYELRSGDARLVKKMMLVK